MRVVCVQDVRDDALHLLGVLSSRIWQDTLKKSKATAALGAVASGGQSDEESQPRVAVVIGNLQDSYQQFQYQLSAKLARCTASCEVKLTCQATHISQLTSRRLKVLQVNQETIAVLKQPASCLVAASVSCACALLEWLTS